MQIACYSSQPYDRQFLGSAARGHNHQWQFFEASLNATTAPLCQGFDAVCAFVNDSLDRECLQNLATAGIKFVALRCAGFNNVDLAACGELGIRVARVPKYSPYAVAEHTIGLILTLNRRIHKAYNRVRENNFALDGLLGFDLHNKVVGVIGTGAIGVALVNILVGFGCRIRLHDPFPNPACAAFGEYVDLESLLRESDIVSLHCPLTPETHHLIGDQAFQWMKSGTMLVNTSRGALVDTQAAITALKAKTLGGLAIDVYEEESHLFFRNLSNEVIDDDTFSRLLTFPNVLVTAHQAFFTREALTEIARVTMRNLDQFENAETVDNELHAGNA
jgi:D-lactate dehydrogenase